MKFTCKYSGRIWYLTNIYGRTHNEDRMDFITWMADLDSSDMHLWMIMGDFNLIRGPENRRRIGGNNNNMTNFNATIQAHDLEEIPLKGREFTWSNMQDSPLLERLDWVFTSPDWTTEFPNTLSFPLARLGSDHVPIHVQIGNNIPKSSIFRFENHWLEFDGFYDTVKQA
jgi:endonuclease/exonuclease/phosphatase family metal-dependent hydrolase